MALKSVPDWPAVLMCGKLRNAKCNNKTIMLHNLRHVYQKKLNKITEVKVDVYIFDLHFLDYPNFFWFGFAHHHDSSRTLVSGHIVLFKTGK